jgi:hypothetical protein
MLVHDLTSFSSGLPNHIIEKAIETLAICRTQLLRLQRFLESTNSNFETLQKKTKRQSRVLSRIFGRPASTDLFDIPKGETILVDLKTGRSALAKLIAHVPPRVNLPVLESINPVRLSESENTIQNAAVPGENTASASPGQRKDAGAIPTPEASGLRISAAITSKDRTAVVKGWLDGGGDVNAKLDSNGNALQIAAADGNEEVMQLLLEHGADPNIDVGDYGPPLQSAAIFGTRSCVQLLLDYGADVNARAGYFGSAIRAAAVSNRLPIVQLLLRQGAIFSSNDRIYVQAYWKREERESASKGLVELVSDIDFSKSQYSTEQFQATMPVVPQQASEPLSKEPSARDLSESFDPRIRGPGIHDFDAPRPRKPISRNETTRPLSHTDRITSFEDGSSNSRLPRELLGSRFQEDFSTGNDETTPASKMIIESEFNTQMFPTSLVKEGIKVSSGPGMLNEIIKPDGNHVEQQNETQIRDSLSKNDEDAGSDGDDVAYPCKGCGDIVSKAPSIQDTILAVGLTRFSSQKAKHLNWVSHLLLPSRKDAASTNQCSRKSLAFELLSMRRVRYFTRPGCQFFVAW